MESYYLAKLYPKETAKAIYTFWRKDHPTETTYSDADSLATIRGDIERYKKPSDKELNGIVQKFLKEKEKSEIVQEE